MRFSAIICGLILVLEAGPTDACGGFFCSQVPVDQSGENIVFSVEGGTVTAHIQIRYVGAAEQFAWILPLPSEPAAPEVSTDLLFVNLGFATQPIFQPRWNYDGCQQGRGYDGDVLAGAEDDAASEGDGEGPPSVEVEFQGAVGPYDAVVLTSDDAQAVQDWLTTNGYDLPPETAQLITPYVESDFHFVALKLQNDRQAGDIVPVKVTFPWDRPCVPLRLTSIAATEDMWVRMWVFSDQRSIPLNYRHVLIDEAKIDWPSYGANYTQVVTDAANEAEGRAFVTEFAGPTSEVRNVWGDLFSTDQYHLDTLALIDDPAAFVNELLAQGFPATPQMQGLLRTHIPMPQALIDQGVSEQEFYNSLSYWQDMGALSGFDFDPVAFAADLETLIVVPLMEAQQMMDLPYLTRMFTTMSPDEMTEDPMFGVSADLDDVSNVHEADIFVYCDKTFMLYQVVLPDGRTIWVDADDATGSWTYDENGNLIVPEDDEAEMGSMARLRADLPGSDQAQQLYEDRQAVTSYDNRPVIAEVLAAHNEAVLGGTPFEEDGCACALASSPSRTPVWGTLLLLGLLLRRRR